MQNSQIEWTDHTFNPWHGCFKVSDGCKHCYAETLSKRFGRDIWGPPSTTPRHMMSENYWKQPLKWNAAAEQVGTRARVFCASMADVFEDHPGVVDARRRLFEMILDTPHLDWLLLTKRPENIKPMLQVMPVLKRDNVWDHLWPQRFPNVWLGTSVENQEQADKRVPELLRIPATIHFLSCEPLLGPLELERASPDPSYFRRSWLEYNQRVRDGKWSEATYTRIEWVICGGESGHGARPMHPDWARSLRDQCHGAGVAFHFKQWGGVGIARLP